MLGPERLTGALLDRLTHRVHILEMNGERHRLKQNKHNEAGNPTVPSSPALYRKSRREGLSSAPALDAVPQIGPQALARAAPRRKSHLSQPLWSTLPRSSGLVLLRP